MPGKREKPVFSFTPPDEPGVIMVGMDVGVRESETVLYVSKPKYAPFHETVTGRVPRRPFSRDAGNIQMEFECEFVRFGRPVGEAIDTEGVEVTQKKMQLGRGEK